ncbi:MAG: hypothetical protein J6T57_03190 [Alphaproteobacteria bacterium]|nr:hypothetical protein [Alphaproteobacteria bacterium]
MITYEEAAKRIENETKLYSPTDKKRLVVPAYGFSGAVDAKRVDWLPPTYEPKEYDVKGLVFYNPKDNAKQVLKQQDGCLIMYDAPGLKDRVEEYIKQKPKTFETVDGIMALLDFLKTQAIDPATGRADVYDTDVNFVSGLVGAPDQSKIKPGIVFVGAKKKETVKAFYVGAGEKFQGATGQPQTAGAGGAYIVSDTGGLRLVQADVFNLAYALVWGPQIQINQNIMQRRGM